jgi:hypothetical protein
VPGLLRTIGDCPAMHVLRYCPCWEAEVSRRSEAPSSFIEASRLRDPVTATFPSQPVRAGGVLCFPRTAAATLRPAADARQAACILLACEGQQGDYIRRVQERRPEAWGPAVDVAAWASADSLFPHHKADWSRTAGTSRARQPFLHRRIVELRAARAGFISHTPPAAAIEDR